jgi:DNA repair protein RadC
MLVRDPGEPHSGALSSPHAVYELLKDKAATWDRERFLTLMLDGGHRLLGIEEVSVGTVNSALVHPREVFKALILANATAFIAVHNHPSGDATPSLCDLEITDRLKRAGEIIGIKLLDHIIIGHGTYRALSEDRPF